ncbi:phosphatases II [Cubamyces sp. BRFM 1775]|nr:phosphatases II [Cubamyces sp. BRFM 1775]
MSTIVHDPRTKPSRAHRISRVASEPLPDLATRDAPMESRTNHPESEDPLIEQLGRLASQHHTSEYNRLKFGPNGSPLVYTPYSVQMPDHYKEMQAHQSRCAEHRAWWPSGCEESEGTMLQGHSKMTPGNSAEMALREEISAAISSPLINSHINSRISRLEPQPHWQTSETHPIVISTVIPSELLPIISSHLERCTHDYPVVFRLPRSYLLDRVLPRPGGPETQKVAPVTAPPPVVLPVLPPCPPPRPSSAQSIVKSLKLPNLFWVHPTVRRAFLGNAGATRSATGKRPRPASFAAPSGLVYPEPDQYHKRPATPRNVSSPVVPRLDIDIPSSGLQGIDLIPSRAYNTQQIVASSFTAQTLLIPEVPQIPSFHTASQLGNMYMSSCPGKKVRLDGPVRGRNTVCRDLRSDLTRIQNVGVACIVCCLDDNELQSLGVTWAEYVQVAGELGIDVLRIPIPEGLPPNDPAMLDSHLSKLIDTYTLRGSAILVHCRGGVGRAGIIACCWMLKLGLCGWLDTEDTDVSMGNSADTNGHAQPQEATLVDPGTMRLVQRLIAVVRRRRSPKAIETYEQVKFLVDYVEFLREQAEPRRASTAASLDWFADWDTQVA